MHNPNQTLKIEAKLFKLIFIKLGYFGVTLQKKTMVHWYIKTMIHETMLLLIWVKNWAIEAQKVLLADYNL